MEEVIILVVMAVLAIPLIRYLVWRARYDSIQDQFKRLELQLDQLKQSFQQLAEKVENLQASRGRKRKTPLRAPVPAPPATKAAVRAKAAIKSKESLQEPFSKPAEHPIPSKGKFEPAAISKQSVTPKLVRKPEPVGAGQVAVEKKPRWAEVESKRLAKGLGSLFKGRGDQVTDWEGIIGRNWLNLAGIIVLVIGMVLLTQQTLLYLGPEGKISTGGLLGLVLLAVGVWLKRWPNYRLLAWTLLGGGWALLYFTAYAAHNIEQAKIIESPVVALVCLLVVAAGIIAHSFTYRSQLLTALAYGLGFMAVTMSPVTIYSLVASLVLAASLVAVLRVLPWHHLVLVGVIGTYLNHWRWLETSTALGAAAEAPATADISKQFWLGIAIVAMYWAVFAAASFIRRPVTSEQRGVHLIANLLNTAGMLGFLGWQIWQYEHGHLYSLTATACVAYIIVAYLDRRYGQQLLFLIDATIAVILFAASLPLFLLEQTDLSKDWLALYWAVGALIVLYAGVRLKEIGLRVEAYLLFAVASLAAWQYNLGGDFAGRSPVLWPIVPIVVVVLTGVDDWLQKVKGQKGISRAATELSWAFAIVATILLARLMWNLVEPEQAGLTWLLIGLALFEAGFATKRHLMRVQGHLLIASGTTVVIAINLGNVGVPDATTFLNLVVQNWQQCLVAAASLYYLAWRMFHCSDRLSRHENDLNFIPSAAATLILMALIFRELEWPMVAAGWMLLGLVLYSVGWLREVLNLRAQAYVLSLCALVGAVSINIYELQPAPEIFGFPPWFFALLVSGGLAGIYSIGQRTASGAVDPLADFSLAASYAATLLLALILWKALPSVGVALAWTILSLALFEISERFDRDSLRYQSHLLMIAVFGRVFMANFTIVDESFGFSHRLLSVTPIIASLYYLRLRMLESVHENAETNDPTANRKEYEIYLSRLYSYAAAILVVALMRFELGRAYAVLGWAAALIIFYEWGRRRDNFDLRVQAYLIAILAFARSWSTSVYLLGSFYGLPERLVTTLPVIAVLMAAGFRSPRQMIPPFELRTWPTYLDCVSRQLFALLASTLVPIVIFYQLSIDYVSMGWAVAALALLAIGFVAQERTYRLCGLALLLVTLGKVTLFDLAGVETIYRILSFIVLGVILLLASLAYARYRKTIERYV
jgi:hypothetical protein